MLSNRIGTVYSWIKRLYSQPVLLMILATILSLMLSGVSFASETTGGLSCMGC